MNDIQNIYNLLHQRHQPIRTDPGLMHPMWTQQGFCGGTAETGGMCQQAKECHQLLATQEARREAWTGSPLESSGSCPCDIGIPLFSKVCFIRAGALGRPRGMGWRGRREGESGWRTHVNPWLIHVNVWQKITTML